MRTAYTIVNFQQAKEILDNNSNSILVDVRTEEEYGIEHAAGAILMPLDDITPELASELIPNKDAKVLIYCRTGRRSKIAAEMLSQYGYKHLYDVGGLAGWPYGLEYGV